MSAREQHVVNELFRRQSLSAMVVRACKRCGAPGFWHDHPDLPLACFDPMKKRVAEAAGTIASVGPVCPNCGAKRDDDEVLGEIWSKVWRGPSIWEQVKDVVMKWR